MNVLLGVCGGIAAYKAAELLRELQRQGAEVQVVLTQGAEKFVTPLTFAALSGRQVLSSLWTPAVSEIAGEQPQPFGIEHIDIAQWADVLVIAPATAHVLAKLANGMADDLLSTIALAATVPVVVAPAMNVNMWRHPATQENLEKLRVRGVSIVEPASGELACGMVGEGRLAEIPEIVSATLHAANPIRDLTGEHLLITAGGTREAIDPVRFLGNRSSGKMGVALAEAALKRGAKVTLITTVNCAVSPGCERVPVESAEEMRAAVLDRLPAATALIMAAAVADYRVTNPAVQKIKKSCEKLTLELERTPDILAEAARLRPSGALIVGFAAETERVVEEGRRKLREKSVDAIVANDVSGSDAGIGADHNAGVMLFADREVRLELSSKRAMAERILDEVHRLRVLRDRSEVELTPGY
ncbi:bifunctional phosphopantothenoylcysteine decarboxylase/phosphopantothenate--cysteine ligase CoaBC [Terriglobus albidus]|uniref:bifunctional phosphopantothenoylcysteine decarboxylase/phosphopantothenate--cysteine ligase CoaBC n=1 Tax=Terriglobus albidus TaxID=1592106 RepID=UPI0021DFFDD6|nr:bifunctional phosphopantothenoylcysteine decarboxylase/phosphopantothenate--cysteine ligase CoaBC [Terriglobus albidus]